MSKPVIKKSELISLINDKGYTRKDLAEHYKVSVGEINKYLKVLNLKLKAKKMTYEIVDDTVVTDVPVVTDNVSAVAATLSIIAADANISEDLREILNSDPIKDPFIN